MKSILLVMYRHGSLSFIRKKYSEGKASSLAVINKKSQKIKPQIISFKIWLYKLRFSVYDFIPKALHSD